jgi:hypothetical protein
MLLRGSQIRITQGVQRRIAFFADPGHPGSTEVSIDLGMVLTAATDEINGNVFVRFQSGVDRLVVPLHEGEWTAA